jgi:DNA repair exonuclease SbcCD ATPase subunit
MTEQDTLWRRMGTFFRPSNAAEAPEDESSDAMLAHTPGGLSSAKSLPWWERRRLRKAQAHEASVRMARLAEAIQQHFQRQDERATTLHESLGRVGQVLEQMAGAQEKQNESLSAIAQHVESSCRHTSTLSDSLGRVPESLLTQAEAIRAVARQIEISQEADTQLMHSLQQFGQAVDTLNSSGTAQVGVLQQLNAAQQQQHDALTQMVREQGRRFATLTIVVGVLSVAVLGALVAMIALAMGGAA